MIISLEIDPQSYMMKQQQTRTTIQERTIEATDYYKRLTEELNKCFDDIELFVRYLEALTEYTKELERDHRRKEKKSTSISFRTFFSFLTFFFFFSGFKTNDRKTS